MSDEWILSGYCVIVDVLSSAEFRNWWLVAHLTDLLHHHAIIEPHVHKYVHSSVCLSVCLCVSVCLSVCLFVSVCVFCVISFDFQLTCPNLSWVEQVLTSRLTSYTRRSFQRRQLVELCVIVLQKLRRKRSSLPLSPSNQPLVRRETTNHSRASCSINQWELSTVTTQFWSLTLLHLLCQNRRSAWLSTLVTCACIVFTVSRTIHDIYK